MAAVKKGYSAVERAQKQATKTANHISAANLLLEHTISHEQPMINCHHWGFMLNSSTAKRIEIC
jgi:hypothetical protein